MNQTLQADALADGAYAADDVPRPVLHHEQVGHAPDGENSGEECDGAHEKRWGPPRTDARRAPPGGKSGSSGPRLPDQEASLADVGVRVVVRAGDDGPLVRAQIEHVTAGDRELRS